MQKNGSNSVQTVSVQTLNHQQRDTVLATKPCFRRFWQPWLPKVSETICFAMVLVTLAIEGIQNDMLTQTPTPTA